MEPSPPFVWGTGGRTPAAAAAAGTAGSRTNASPLRPTLRSTLSGLAIPRSSPDIPFGATTSTTSTASMSNTATATGSTGGSGASQLDPALVPALREAIEDSLVTGLYPNAVFLAERLFECKPTYRHLQILATCHARSGTEGLATSCRLLQHYYPFFPDPAAPTGSSVAATLPSPMAHAARTNTKANANSSSDTLNRNGLVQAPAQSHYGAHAEREGAHLSPQHEHHQQRPACYEELGSNGAPAAFRAAVHRGDDGRALPPSATTATTSCTVAARWDCQYLLGVSCARVGRWTDGARVLDELVRLSARLEAAVSAGTLTAADFMDDDDEGEHGRNNGCRRAREEYEHGDGEQGDVRDPGRDAKTQIARARPASALRALGSVTSGCPRFYVQRLAEVRHWLGLCAHRQHHDTGVELQRLSFTANPLLFCSLDAFVSTALKPSEGSCLPVYERAEPPVAFSAAAAPVPVLSSVSSLHRHSHNHNTNCYQPQRQYSAATSNAMTSSNSRRHHEDNAISAAAAEHWRRQNIVRRFLAPFARGAFLTHTFRCKEAITALQATHFPSEGSAALRSDADCNSIRSNSSWTVYPAGAWRLSSLTMAHFHSGDMRGCVRVCQSLLSAAPWRLNDITLLFYSTALWQLRAEDALGALAQRLTEEMPMAPLTLCVVANAYSLVKEPKDALAMIDRALQLDASLAYAHALRGYELLSLGMNNEARDAFHRAISADRNMYTAYAGLGELLVREEHLELARQHFKHAISINRLPTIMNRYAATYHRPGATREDLLFAYGIYEEAVRENATNVAARHRRADVLLALGRPKEAMADLRALVGVYTDEADVFVTLARCQEALGQTQQAVLSYHRAAALDPRREGYVRGCLERLSAAAGGEEES